MQSPSPILTALILGMLVLPECQATRFPCSVGYPLNIDIGQLVRHEDFIVPEVENNAIGMGPTSCTWNLKLATETPRQVLLHGISRNLLVNRRGKRSTGNTQLRYQLHSRYSCSKKSVSAEPITVDIGMFQVVSLLPGDTLTVTTDQAQLNAEVALRVVSLDEGYCAKDMTAYGESCYHSSAVKSLRDTLQLIDQNQACAMQLASFGSLNEIRNFIQANKPKIDVYPTKTPLNLTRSVRIGLFYTKSTKKVSRLTTNGKICEMEVVGNPEDFLSTATTVRGQCGSLRVNESGDPIIEFVDCQDKMPALLVFPERPLNSCLHYTAEIEKWLQTETEGTTENGQVWTTENGMPSSIVVVVACAVSVVYVAVVSILIWTCFIRGTKRRAGMNSDSPSAKEAGTVDTKANWPTNDQKLSNPMLAEKEEKASEDPEGTNVVAVESERKSSESGSDESDSTGSSGIGSDTRLLTDSDSEGHKN